MKLNYYYKTIYKILLFFFSLTLSSNLSAQDAMVIGFNFDSLDGFSIVALKDLPDTTPLYITTTAYNPGSNIFDRSSGNMDTWRISWTGTWEKGTIIYAEESTSTSNIFSVTVSTNGPAGASVVSPYGDTIAISNDAYQIYTSSNATDPERNITEISSYVMFSEFQSGFANPDPSDDPNCPCASNFVTIDLDNATADHAQFNPILRGEEVTKAALEDRTNWVTGTTNLPISLTEFANLNLAINTAPVATAPTAPVVLEDATNVALPNTIQVTDTDTDDQTLTFTVTGGTVTLGTTGITFGGSGNGTTSFTAQGTLAAINAALDAATFTPTANLNGINAGSIAFVSNDGTIDSNNASVTFNITPVNDAPSFTIGANQSVNEDAGAQTVTGFATALDDGDTEVTQLLSFSVSNNNNGLFSVQPSINTMGALIYTPATDAIGVATVSVILSDDGGTANSGDDTFATQQFTITLDPVNDEPSFTIGANQSVNEDAGAQTVNSFITNIEDGDGEVTQVLSFSVSNNNNGLFSAQPAVDAFGNLTYTPAADLFGTATVSVNIIDDGGTANGGDDTSANQTFTITVNQVNDTPVVITSVSDDTGSSTTDYITNDNTPTVNGTAEPGSTITLVVNGTSTALFGITATTNSSGVFTFPFPAVFGSLPDATATLSANATFNGTTLSSSNQSVTIDTVDPTVPTVVTQTTNDTTPTIIGTNALSTALPAGETMTVSVNGATYTVVPNASGNWSLEIGTDMPASGSVGIFVNGVSYEVVATVTDIAGNTATDISNFEITIDTANPTVAITSTENSPTVNQSFPISITFSEVVTDFELIDITVGNGTASNLATDDDITFTATITAATDGVVTVDVANGVSQDIAGNDNEAASEFSISFEDPALSIGDNTLQANDFNFVNPVGNELIINSPIIINEITLYSLSGTIVAFVKGNIVDTSSLASGIYIASIVSEKGTSATVKIVKK